MTSVVSISQFLKEVLNKEFRNFIEYTKILHNFFYFKKKENACLREIINIENDKQIVG